RWESPRSRPRLSTRQRSPCKPSMTAARRLGSTTSKSASRRNSRAASSRLWSPSDIPEAYQTLVRKTSVNSRQIIQFSLQAPPPPHSSQSSSKQLHSRDDTPAPEADLWRISRQGTRHLPAWPQVRDRDQHPPRRRNKGPGLG